MGPTYSSYRNGSNSIFTTVHTSNILLVTYCPLNVYFRVLYRIEMPTLKSQNARDSCATYTTLGLRSSITGGVSSSFSSLSLTFWYMYIMSNKQIWGPCWYVYKIKYDTICWGYSITGLTW